MEKFLKNLSNLISAEICRIDCTYSYFADKCGLSRDEIRKIVNLSKKDINVSTILKICENSEISILDIFQCSDIDIFERMLRKFVFTNGEKSYQFCKR